MMVRHRTQYFPEGGGGIGPVDPVAGAAYATVDPATTRGGGAPKPARGGTPNGAGPGGGGGGAPSAWGNV
jgi:hypothetical protein